MSILKATRSYAGLNIFYFEPPKVMDTQHWLLLLDQGQRN